jgi:hypothetical protein
MSKAAYYSIREAGREVEKAKLLFPAASAWSRNPGARSVFLMDVTTDSIQGRPSKVKELSESFLREILKRHG